MSHVTSISFAIKDLEALERACPELGLEFVRDQKKYRWYGRSVGDTPLPEGFTAKDLGKCEHVIRVKGAAGNTYEVGVVKSRVNPGTYELQFDSWQGGYGLMAKIGENANHLRQGYAVETTKSWARKNGYRVSVLIGTDGRKIVKARK